MVRPDQERLRGAAGKTQVAGAVEDLGDVFGRVRLQVIPDASAQTLAAFVEAHVEPGGTIKTDGLSAYAALDPKHCRHRPRVQGGRERASQVLPHTSTASSPTSRPGSRGPITAWTPSTCRPT